MKNKSKQIIVVCMAVILFFTSNARADTYAGRGALIGALTFGIGSGITGAYIGGGLDCTGSQCTQSDAAGIGILLGLIGAAVGAGVGAGIGSAFTKDPKVSVAPIYSHSKVDGNTTGATVAVHF